MEAAEICQWKRCAAAFSFVLQEKDIAKLAKPFQVQIRRGRDEKACDWAAMW